MTQLNKTPAILRELRDSTFFSYEDLSYDIKKKTGISISHDSLRNYEVLSSEYHSKANAAKGMSIEKLAALADYYGVTTDYLLGRSSYKSPSIEVDAVCKYTGLSPVAVTTIANLSPDETATLSTILESSGLLSFLWCLGGLQTSVDNSHELSLPNNGVIPLDIDDDVLSQYDIDTLEELKEWVVWHSKEMKFQLFQYQDAARCLADEICGVEKRTSLLDRWLYFLVNLLNTHTKKEAENG